MILVTGGTGFLGHHLVPALIAAGLKVRCLVHRRPLPQTLRALGIEEIPGSILEVSSLQTALQGVEQVVHLVGIILETRKRTFETIHVEGTRRLLEAARAAGVRQFVYVSALGARPQDATRYHRTKWEAEELVRASGLPFTIVRPSVIYGPGDAFVSRFARLLRMAPVFPFPRSGRLQPIHVEDVVACLRTALQEPRCLNQTFCLAGPDRLTLEEILRALLDALHIRRLLVPLSPRLLRPLVRMQEAILPSPPLTLDQLRMLQEEHPCDPAPAEAAFGRRFLPFREGVARSLGSSHDA